MHRRSITPFLLVAFGALLGCRKAQPAGPPAPVGPYATRIATGPGHACAVTNESTVFCWGINNSGQLGDGTRESRTTPVQVLGLTGVAEVEVGEEFSCARKTDGTVLCWGAGSYGQLGNNQRGNAPTAVPVLGLTGAVDIELGNYHACAALSDGTARCWGANVFGQGGQDPTARELMQPTVVAGLRDVVEVGAGQNHSCARTRDGAVYCWGYNSSGQLGDGTRAQHPAAVAVAGLAGARRLSTGNNHNCAVLTDGTARCWGDGVYGQLGTGAGSNTPAVFPLQGFRDVVAGQSATCALMNDGTVRCMGYNADGRLGTGATGNVNAPTPVNGVAGVATLGGGGGYTCAIFATNATQCWGTLRRIAASSPPVIQQATPGAVQFGARS